MLATGELRPLATELDFLELAELLRRKVAGEPLPSYIHEVNAYSAAPEDLVRDRGPAPGTDGKGMAWYFYGAANCHESAGGAPRRNRQVGGGRERRFWHPEGGKKPIVDRDSKPVGAYWRTLSYVSKTKNPSGAKKSFRNTRLGWCMIEIGLDHHHQLVLCKVYMSPRGTADPAESCTAVAGAEDVGPAAGTGLSGVEDGLHDSALEGGAIPDVTGGGMSCPPEPPPGSYDYNLHSRGVAQKPALLLIGPASKHGTLAIVNRSNAASAAATIVMKFGGSSIPSAERMKEMAKLVLVSQNPVVVLLSAMGNTNTNIRLAAWKALRCGARKANEIDELAIIKELHLRTIDELGLDRSIVSGSLDELEQHLQYVAMTKELTPSTQDYLISFGERASTKMFSDYLNKLGKEEWELCSITNFGRSGGDLTTTTIGRALGLREIQVWRDVDSMFTCDPKVCGNAIHVPYLTFDEAAELRYISEQSMQIAMEGGIKAIVKNSYNPQARATVITKTRDMSKSILTSIALKSNITILDIERTSTLDQNAFVEKAISIFQNFEYLSISVDWIATSEGKMSFTLVPSKLLTQELIQPALDMSVHELQNIADVHRLHDMSVISLIGNPGRSIDILGKALSILQSSDVAVEKVSQGVSKVMKISLVVHDTVAKHGVQALHSAFFELNDDTPALVKSSGSGNKRKADAGHPEAPLGMHREKMVTECMVLKNLERTLLSDINGDPTEFFDSVSSDNMGVYYDEDQACGLAASGLEVEDYFRFEDMLLGGLPPNVFPSPYNPETLHEFHGGDFGGFPCKYSWSSLFFKCSWLWASLSFWWLQVKARYRFHHQTC